MDFTYEMIDDHIHKPLDHGWVRDNNYMSKQALTLALKNKNKNKSLFSCYSQVKDFHLVVVRMVDVHFCSKQCCILNFEAHLVARCHGWKILWLQATTPPILSLAFQLDLTWSLAE
jgi:hypothetical protein